MLILISIYYELSYINKLMVKKIINLEKLKGASTLIKLIICFCFLIVLLLVIINYSHSETNLPQWFKGQGYQKGNGEDIEFKAFHIGQFQDKESQFNLQERFSIQVEKVSFSHPHYFFIKFFDFQTVLLPNSPFDYLNISKRINFTELAHNLFLSLPYYQYSFKYSPKLEKKSQILRLNYFKHQWNSSDSIQLIKKIVGVEPQEKNFGFFLSQQMLKSNDIIDQIQYSYYDNKYHIGQRAQELPICIYSGGYKVWSKQRFIEFFHTLENINYTNFHVIYLDDNSPNNQILSIVSFLQNQDFRIKNRIKIVQTLAHVESTGNIPFFIKEYCQPGEIVAILDPDDGLLGKQALKVLNSVYSNPQIWFSYSKLLTKQNPNLKNGKYSQGYTKKLTVPPNKFRNNILWEASALRSFRYNIFVKIPFESMIKNNQRKAYPFFSTYASDMVQYFNILQMTGQKHYIFIDDYLYWYIGSTKSGSFFDCSRGFEVMDDIKFRLRNQIKTLNEIGDQINYLEPQQKQLQKLKRDVTIYYILSGYCHLFRRLSYLPIFLLFLGLLTLSLLSWKKLFPQEEKNYFQNIKEIDQQQIKVTS